RVFSRGWDRMKLYFIAGLPTETDEDLAGIIDAGRRAIEVGRQVSRKRLAVTVSVSVHVPKPHTPFQWCAMDGLAEIRRKQDLLRQMARTVRGLDLRLHDSTGSVLEGIFARGDRRLADVIERAYQNGARFDSWEEHFRPAVWDEALNHFGIDRSQYLGTLPVDGRLPWDHIDVGLDPEFLPREYRKALKGQASPPCGKPVGMHVHHTNAEDALSDARKLVCYHCGIECDMTKMRQDRVEHLTVLGAQHRDPMATLSPPPNPSPRPSPTEALVNADSDAGGLESKDVPSAVVEAESDAESPSSERAASPEAHRPAQLGGQSVDWRLRFEKTGPASMLGHLDLIRELPRVFRRAGVRVAYSRGFHPKPSLSFAPALSLGVASLDEYVDASLLDAPPREQLLDALSRASASGIRFLDATWLKERTPSLSKCIAAARYAVVVPEALFQSLGGRSGVGAKLDEFMAQSSYIFTRHLDRQEKRIDMRQFVSSLALGQPSLDEEAHAAGIRGDFQTLELVVAITPTGSVKALEVAQALFGESSRDCRAVRTALLDRQGRPLFHRFHAEGFDAS
ncbi:MAG TPA: TIGR03936 family radical SAM-associated protein, partial [Polyangiaceae bacterium]|nr:TIGR03936 family radical SAM-associated protein [Polyangiaceae bacterium]